MIPLNLYTAISVPVFLSFTKSSTSFPSIDVKNIGFSLLSRIIIFILIILIIKKFLFPQQKYNKLMLTNIKRMLKIVKKYMNNKIGTIFVLI